MKHLIKKKRHIDSVEAYWCEGCPGIQCACPCVGIGTDTIYQSRSTSTNDQLEFSMRNWPAER